MKSGTMLIRRGRSTSGVVSFNGSIFFLSKAKAVSLGERKRSDHVIAHLNRNDGMCDAVHLRGS